LQFEIKLSLQIPPHLKCVATLPCEMSDDALKPAMPLINVDRDMACLNSPDLNPVSYAVRDALQQIACQC